MKETAKRFLGIAVVSALVVGDGAAADLQPTTLDTGSAEK